MEQDDKPRANTLLILLTLFDLVGVAGASAPFITFAKMTGEATSLNLLYSLPAVAVGMVIAAWILNTKDKRRLAMLVAAMPLIWGMTVFVMLNG